jgi:hypothetical protein
MDKLIAFLHNTRFVTGVTWVAFVLAIFLTGLAAWDLNEMGLEQPNEARRLTSEILKLQEMNPDYRLKLDSLRHLILRATPDVNLTPQSPDISVMEEGIRLVGKKPVPHLARVVSGFSSCLFLLLFLFLYINREKSNSNQEDFSLLFLALSLLAWCLPLPKNGNSDHGSMLNSLMLLGFYWGIEIKIPQKIKQYIIEKLKMTISLRIFIIIFFIITGFYFVSFYFDKYFDFVDKLISVSLHILLGTAFFFTFERRFRGHWIGRLLAILVCLGFVCSIIQYLSPSNDLRKIFIIISEFFIIVSSVFLAFSWSYEREKEKANALEDTIIKLKEEQKKLQDVNIDLEKQKSELEKNKDALQSLNIKLEEEQEKLQDANVDLEKQKSELEKNEGELQSLNKKLEEEQKKLQDANVDLEKQKSELEEINKELEKEKINVVNSRGDALHSLGNSLILIQRDFETKASNPNMDIAQTFKECAVNLEVLLALFEDRVAYGKSTIYFKHYIFDFLSKIEKAFMFDKFDFRTRVLVGKDIECKISPLQKVAKILYELSLNAKKKGGAWVEIDIDLDENDSLILRFTDKGGWFDINQEYKGKGIGIIKNYTNLINLEVTPITREQNTTIILFNFKPIIVR